MLGYAKELEAIGYFVVSRWIDGHHEHNSKHGSQADYLADGNEQATWASEDYQQVFYGDMLVQFTGGDVRKRGGKHVELGLALAWHKKVYIVGEPENVFHYLPSVTIVPTFEDLKRLLAALGEDNP